MVEEKRPLKVFLCHAHSDKDKVRALYSRLKREGVDAWLDKEKLLPGSDWELEIRKAVREADVVVVCLSKQFNQAGFRQKEVRIALDTAMEQPEGEIFIIPARLEECENLESLSKWHWVDLFEDDGYGSLIRALRARADRIGATLRIRKASQSITTRPKNKEPEKTVEPPVSNIDIGDTVSANAIVTEIHETQNIERAEREAAEKEEREAAQKAAQEKAQKEIQRRLEKSIKKAKRDLWWRKLKIDIRYRFRVIYIYRRPILILLVTLAIVTPLLIRLSNIIPKLTQAFNVTPTTAITLTAQLTIPSKTIEPSQSLTPNSTSTKASTPIPTLGIGSTLTSEKDGMVMVYVPEGSFTMGTDNGYSYEGPAHQVFLNSFWIDRTEVTHDQYAKCVQEGECYSNFNNLDFPNYPIIRVDWYDAAAYCSWAGRRLPTEAEWEKTARGTDARKYPWGDNDPACRLANTPPCNRKDYSQVGSSIAGASPYGAYDMIGNAWEWVSDWYSDTYYANSPVNNPVGPAEGTYRVLRGGSYSQAVQVPSRNWFNPKSYIFYIDTGLTNWMSVLPSFRCSMDASP